jgi:hypothetical protein
MEIFEARVLGENLYLHQRFTVFKVEYFLYIIQVMLIVRSTSVHIPILKKL